MSQRSAQDLTEAAQGYEDLLVPALFQQWTTRVLDAAAVGPGQHVLDVACGTGVLAREAAGRVGAAGRVSAIDPNPGMLALAKLLAPGVDWRQATAEALPYAEASFDAVVSQFGLMFFNDPRQALQEMVRVLAPNGRLAVAVWDSLENNPAYATEVALLERIAGTRAADAVRVPFALGDRDDLIELFAGAGVPSTAVATHLGTGEFPSVRSMVEADLRGWLPVMGVELAEKQIQHILAQAESALAQYVTVEGRVAFDMSSHIVTGAKT